ncbi:MAG TPA: calcium-binding protein [Conexibacter sp.]|nr:calcium-binding protein [Conexibacter sp.]
MLRRTRTALAAAAAIALLAPPAAAQARGTITYDGTTMTFSGDGAADHVGIGVSQGELSWVTSGLDAIPAQCTAAEYVDHTAYCPFPQRIVVDLGGGNDSFSISSAAWDPFPAAVAVEVRGGDGDDRIQSAQLQDGGAGRDRLEGHDGDQTLRGGPGDDVLDGGAGNDQVYGEDGNDSLNGDQFKAPGRDVIDGGPGEDVVESEWAEGAQKATQPVTITLDGVADDGRPGEGDNVVGIERFKVYTGGTFHGTDGVDTYEIEPGEIRHPATVLGKGGNDRLVGDDDVETIDGGPGDDYLEGGWNNDTLIGGPGRDTVFADDTGAHCNYWTWCRLPFGNDTVDVRDGEVDTVDCGIGTDTVKADPVDLLSSCETVDTGVAPPVRRAPEGGGGRAPLRRAGEKALAVKVSGAKLGAALRSGLSLEVGAPGAGKVSATLKRGKTTVGGGSARVRKGGTVALKVRFSKAGARVVKQGRGAKKLTLMVRFTPKGGGAARVSTAAVTLKR